MQFSMRIEGGTKYLEGILKNFAKEMRNPRGQARGRIEGIINRGIMKNHETLAWGGSVRAAGGSGGFSHAWLQVRHPLTKKIRESQGLGGVLPLLHFRGFLQKGLGMGGRIRGSTAGGMVWVPNATGSYRDLIKVHETGGVRLGRPGDAPGGYPKGMRVPQRQSIFWSHEMATQVRDVLAEGAKKAVGRRA